MKISLAWLQRYLPLEKTPKAIEEALNMIGFEVEGVEKTGLPLLEKVIVGEITSSEPHPNADRLRVCEVATGGGAKPRTIVCGATNYAVGDRVPVALPGAVLPGNLKIKKSKLRGVVSHGMMCSAKELSLGEEHEGLLILADRPEVGKPIKALFPDGDVVFDIEVTPNRPDCLSHLGIGRELAAFFGLRMRYPELGGAVEESSPIPSRELLHGVRVEVPENCPHYLGYSIKGVRIAPSPEWLQRLLKTVGLRPINNVVDVTNFILFETGQPLHAFDAAKIGGSALIIRRAAEGEEITTLDGKKRRLNSGMTVIADTEKALVVAGVMGSVDAEVDDATSDLVLESAYFNPANIRSTSRQLNLSSDSSYRFERGVDPGGAEFAARRAIDLILETAGGASLGLPQVAGQPPSRDRVIAITPGFIQKNLGFPVEEAEINRIFASLELKTERGEESGTDSPWRVTIPSFRTDLERPIDLVEEFLRIYGTDKIPRAEVLLRGLVHEDDPVARFKKEAANYLASLRFNECINYSMREAAELRRWYGEAVSEPLRLENPLVRDQSHLRASLLPGLLDNLVLNRNRGNDPERLFEMGNVFRVREEAVWELVSAAFLIVQSPPPENWLRREAPDFYLVSQIIDQVLGCWGEGVEGNRYAILEKDPLWQAEQAAGWGDFVEDGFEVQAGLLNLALLKNRDIEGTVLAGSVFLRPSFLKRSRPHKTFQPFSQFPSARRDLALVVDKTVPAERVRSRLEAVSRMAAGNAFGVERVSLFDLFEGKGLPPGKKSLAFSISFRSSERTLTDLEVNGAFSEIREKIMEGTGFAVRI